MSRKPSPQDATQSATSAGATQGGDADIDLDAAYRSWKARFIVASKGLAMGAADIIPGVSGGTIALISGIYEHLIQAIGSIGGRHALAALQLALFFWSRPRRRQALATLGEIPWSFLLPLGAGIVLAILAMSRFIPVVLEHYAYYAFAFFFGLIVFSISVPYRLMKHGGLEYALILIFAVAAFFLVGLSRVSNATLSFVPQAAVAQQDRAQDDSPANDSANDATNDASNDSAQDAAATDAANAAAAAEARQREDAVRIQTDGKGKWEVELATPPGGVQVWDVYLEAESGGRIEHFTLTVSQANLEELSVETSADELRDLDVEVEQIEGGGPTAESVRIAGRLSVHGNDNPLVVFFSGAFAICAMILPGISGAYILVLLGQYRLVLDLINGIRDGLKTLLTEGSEAAFSAGLGHDLFLLFVFLAGLAVGILSFVRILKRLLAKYHSPVMAALTGLMIGSLRSIWPGAYYPEHAALAPTIALGLGIALLGAVLVFALERASVRLKDPDSPGRGQP